jgi:hypothetical protein
MAKSIYALLCLTGAAVFIAAMKFFFTTGLGQEFGWGFGVGVAVAASIFCVAARNR